MAKNKRTETQSGGVSIDSEKDAIVGNDLVGRDKVINVYKDTKPKSKSNRTDLVECPLCGKYNDQRNSFRCLSCNRHYICLEHRNPSALICAECVQEAKTLVSDLFDTIISSFNNGRILTAIEGEYYTSKIVFDKWGSRFPEYNQYSSKMKGYDIQEVRHHSSGRITVMVAEKWHLVHKEYNDITHDDSKSLSSRIELIRVENIIKIDACYFFGCARAL